MSTTDEYQPVVDRLIMQYREYTVLSVKIADLENDKLAVAAKEAQSQEVSLLTVLQQNNNEELEKIDVKIKIAKQDLQRVSDEMSFANHIIWLMYKYQAYKGASNEIATLGALRRHCSPIDYICTKRFQYLQTYLLEHNAIDINDESEFLDNMPLDDLIQQEMIVSLLNDLKFLELWKSYEYHISDSTIAKWKNFVSEQGLA